MMNKYIKRLYDIVLILTIVGIVFISGWFIWVHYLKYQKRGFITPTWIISGTVINEKQQGVAGVLIDVHGLNAPTASERLLNRVPTTSSITTMTDKDGRFKFQIAADYVDFVLKKSNYDNMTIVTWPDTWHVKKPLLYVTNANIRIKKWTGTGSVESNSRVIWHFSPQR